MRMYKHTLPLRGLGYVQPAGNHPDYPPDLHFVRTKGLVDQPVLDRMQQMVESISSTRVTLVNFESGGYLFKEINS